MAIANNHKMALLYMMRILLEQTDDDHALNASQLIEMLGEYGCEADRRTIYSNVEILQDFGLDILKNEGGAGGYYVGSREFELPELKLLVDAVQSSKFITSKKTQELIGKIEKLTNEQKARDLNRAVFIRNRMKAGNETIYYNVDGIHEAMNRDRRIAFSYAEWTTDKKLVPKREGADYVVSPWALTWDDENYYLIAFDEGSEKERGRIKHFRVDKMLDLRVLEDKSREGQEAFKDFDLAAFAKKTFGMYGGREVDVTLRCANELAGVVFDRFGTGVMPIPDGEGAFTLRVPIALSHQFFGWVTGIGPGMEIVAPEDVRKEYREYLEQMIDRHRD